MAGSGGEEGDGGFHGEAAGGAGGPVAIDDGDVAGGSEEGVPGAERCFLIRERPEEVAADDEVEGAGDWWVGGVAGDGREGQAGGCLLYTSSSMVQPARLRA